MTDFERFEREQRVGAEGTLNHLLIFRIGEKFGSPFRQRHFRKSKIKGINRIPFILSQRMFPTMARILSGHPVVEDLTNPFSTKVV